MPVVARRVVAALAVALPALALPALAAAQAGLVPDAPIPCESCADWVKPVAPFRLFGESYYVGTEGLSSVVIRTPEGLILLDGGLPQSAPSIAASLAALGLPLGDVRYILSSHAHFDHAGGIAALQRATQATVVASASSAEGLRRGGPVRGDPQWARKEGRFPRVEAVQVIGDGEAVTLGGVTVTAYLTPGHTPGATTWTWRSCEGARCADLVYADSLNAVSLPGFSFSGGRGGEARVAAFRASIAAVEALPCDLIVAVHPGFTSLFEARDRRDAGEAETLLDPGGCRAYAQDARARLDARLAEEARE